MGRYPRISPARRIAPVRLPHSAPPLHLLLAAVALTVALFPSHQPPGA